MVLPRVPPLFVGALASLPERLEASGRERGMSSSDVSHIIELVPAALRLAPCFLDRSTGLWRYYYGLPIDLPENQVVVGTNIFVPVDRLFEVLACAEHRLSSAALDIYLQRLQDASRHQDVLAEMAPALRVDPRVVMEFEVPGQAVGNLTIDWLISPTGFPPILLEVKNRIRDLIEYLAQLARGEPISAPAHDASLLFRSAVEKLLPSDPAVRLQGVWIITELKQEESELEDTFANNASLLHFAILNNWEPDGYLLTCDGVDRRQLLDLFRLQESRNSFVFRRDQS